MTAAIHYITSASRITPFFHVQVCTRTQQQLRNFQATVDCSEVQGGAAMAADECSHVAYVQTMTQLRM